MFLCLCHDSIIAFTLLLPILGISSNFIGSFSIIFIVFSPNLFTICFANLAPIPSIKPLPKYLSIP